MFADDYIFSIAPGEDRPCWSLLYDKYAEELSFPSIYYGHPRKFSINVTAFDIASSEIRRRDRRAATPDHTLYTAAKLIRQRFAANNRIKFRKKYMDDNKNIREMIQNKEFVNQMLEQNTAFESGLPNSIQYW